MTPKQEQKFREWCQAKYGTEYFTSFDEKREEWFKAYAGQKTVFEVTIIKPATGDLKDMAPWKCKCGCAKITEIFLTDNGFTYFSEPDEPDGTWLNSHNIYGSTLHCQGCFRELDNDEELQVLQWRL